MLISNYKISGKDIYLNEALKWCDTFVSLQHDITTSINTIGGYWDTGYSEGTSCVPCSADTNQTVDPDTDPESSPPKHHVFRVLPRTETKGEQKKDEK